MSLDLNRFNVKGFIFIMNSLCYYDVINALKAAKLFIKTFLLCKLSKNYNV